MTARLIVSVSKSLVIVAALLSASLTPAYGATLYVANNGVDGAGCGAKVTPCRSISQAIANAADGDQIIVGPGRYGDLNRNGTLGETGEETPSAGCGCVLSINKPLIVESSDGAAATIIDARSVIANGNVLVIADGAEFGRPGKGFMVTTTKNGGYGVAIDATDVKIRGNQVTGNTGSFGITTVDADETILIEGNQVFVLGIGIQVLGAHKTVSKNHVLLNVSSGIEARGGPHDLVGNVVIGNDRGINLIPPFSDAITIQSNAIIGNPGDGIFVDNPTSTATAERNNIFGNGTTGTNCGLHLDGGSIPATRNYWGAAAGPGPDPADGICNGTATTAPVATSRFHIDPSIRP